MISRDVWVRIGHNHIMWGVRPFPVATVMLTAAWLVSACQSTQQAALPAPSAPLDRSEMEEILATGFSRISSRYLEPVSAGDLALHGLRGLASIDPALGTNVSGGRVRLNVDEDTVASEPAPPSGDAAAWGAVSTRIIQVARRHSADLARIDNEKLYEAVFDGALSSLDLFSRYAGAEEARKNRAKRDGFGGIGILFRMHEGKARITTVIGDTPAARAGLKVGDIISHIGDIPLNGLNRKAVTAQLRGRIGTRVSLKVVRGEDARVRLFHVVRARVILPTVAARTVRGVAIMRISGFNQDTADSIERHLKRQMKLHKGRIRGIALDLRGNPGGLLSESIEVADLFLKRGQIISTRGRHRDSIQYYEASPDDIAPGLPLVVLMDGKSASAAEIVAAALQDRGRAVVVGTTSFGKGTVQTVLRLPNDGEITLTWSRFIAPSGYALHELGVMPTVCTSGAKRGEGAKIVSSALADPLKSTARFTTWREVSVADTKRRKELRRICAPQRRRLRLEHEVALDLINDSDLLARALQLPMDPALARKPGDER